MVVVIRAPYAVSAIVSVATLSKVVNVAKVSTKKMKKERIYGLCVTLIQFLNLPT
jgi:hypothetical protein